MLWNLFLRGGFAMWPLLFCTVVALAIILDRAWYFWVSTRTPAASEEAIAEAVAALAGGRHLEAMQLVRRERGVASSLMSAALGQAGQPRAAVEEALARAGRAEVLKLQRGLGTLEAIVTVAPLLGLLGTVTGIIRTFNVVGAMAGVSSPAQMAPGIAEALFTTAFGLMIASPSVIMHAIFLHEVDRRVVKMNNLASQILQALAQGGDRAGFEAEIARTFKGNPEQTVIIKADRDIRYARLVEALDAVREHGGSRIALAVEPQSAAPTVK